MNKFNIVFYVLVSAQVQVINSMQITMCPGQFCRPTGGDIYFCETKQGKDKRKLGCFVQWIPTKAGEKFSSASQACPAITERYGGWAGNFAQKVSCPVNGSNLPASEPGSGAVRCDNTICPDLVAQAIGFCGTNKGCDVPVERPFSTIDNAESIGLACRNATINYGGWNGSYTNYSACTQTVAQKKAIEDANKAAQDAAEKAEREERAKVIAARELASRLAEEKRIRRVLVAGGNLCGKVGNASVTYRNTNSPAGIKSSKDVPTAPIIFACPDAARAICPDICEDNGGEHKYWDGQWSCGNGPCVCGCVKVGQ